MHNYVPTPGASKKINKPKNNQKNPDGTMAATESDYNLSLTAANEQKFKQKVRKSSQGDSTFERGTGSRVVSGDCNTNGTLKELNFDLTKTQFGAKSFAADKSVSSGKHVSFAGGDEAA
jgi:hypothetical protein